MCLRQIILPFQSLQARLQQPAGYRCSRRSGRKRRLRTWCSLPGTTHSCSPKRPCCCWSRRRHIQCQCPVLCTTLKNSKNQYTGYSKYQGKMCYRNSGMQGIVAGHRRETGLWSRSEFDWWRPRSAFQSRQTVYQRREVREQKFKGMFVGWLCSATSLMPCLTPGVSFTRTVTSTAFQGLFSAPPAQPSQHTSVGLSWRV